MTDYYARNLSGLRLQRVYEIAPPRVRQYLEGEVNFLLSLIAPGDRVLELGCGCGRIALRLADKARHVVGIDIAPESLDVARSLDAGNRCEFLLMDALHLDFPDDRFDVVACLQNGLCAFRVDRDALVREALRVTRPGGLVVVSTYSDRFWPHRLAWFEAQAADGLIGPIDYESSRDGVIVCADGFRARRLTPIELRKLCDRLDVSAEIVEVDESSVFCLVRKAERD